VGSKDFDVIVAGAGVMGLATAWQLSKRGAKVLVLDKFGIPSGVGSSYGHTRLIRKAYFEHPDYVPLLHRAYELWRALELESNLNLLLKTGLIVSGPESHPILSGIRSSAQLHGLAIERYGIDELSSRYPQFQHPQDHIGLFEADAGCLLVEKSLVAFKESTAGGRVSFSPFSAMESWTTTATSVSVRTRQGEFSASKLVLSAGSWMHPLMALPKIKLEPRRAPVFWFDAPGQFDLAQGMPCFAFAMPEGFFYGFPNIDGEGVKIAHHKGLQLVSDLDDLSSDVLAGDFDPVGEFVKAQMPRIAKEFKAYGVCRYTMSIDEHFILGAHPDHPRVCIASPCSGHGFKFAPVIGEILADLALNDRTELPIDFLSPQRF
jgi:sarcosine oxidase